MILKNSLLAKAFLLCTLVFVSCSSEDEEETMTENPVPESGLVEYTDVKFAVDQDGVESARFFSTISGEMYSFNEINEEIGATIDLVWYDSSPTNQGFLFWESPDDLFGDLVLPGATATKIENYQPTLSGDQFKLIERKEQLNVLTVEHSDDAMGPIAYPVAILFENAAGKKGIILMKSNDGEFLTVDIKVVY